MNFLASLYEGAVLLFTTGQTGALGLWSFSCAFSVGGWGVCLIYLMCSFGTIWLHCCAGFWIRIWSLLVGLSGRVWKLLSVRKVCTFLVYSCLYMITVALLTYIDDAWSNTNQVLIYRLALTEWYNDALCTFPLHVTCQDSPLSNGS